MNRESSVYNTVVWGEVIYKKKKFLKSISKLVWRVNVTCRSSRKNRQTRGETWTTAWRPNGADRRRTSPVASWTWTRWPPATGTSGNTGSWRPRTADSRGRRTAPGTCRSCSRTWPGYRGRCPPAWSPCTRCSPWTWRSWSRSKTCRRRRKIVAPCCWRSRAFCACARARTVRTDPDSIPETETSRFNKVVIVHNVLFFFFIVTRTKSSPMTFLRA